MKCPVPKPSAQVQPTSHLQGACLAVELAETCNKDAVKKPLSYLPLPHSFYLHSKPLWWRPKPGVLPIYGYLVGEQLDAILSGLIGGHSLAWMLLYLVKINDLINWQFPALAR